MADDFQDKTEQPTQKRLDEARKKGNVAKSMEINSALSLLTGLLLIYLMSGMFFKQISSSFRNIMGGGYMIELTPLNIRNYFIQGLETFGFLILLFLGGILVVGVTSSILQVGFLFTLEPLSPKFSKLNPLKGFKKIVISKRSLEELFKNLLKLTIIIIVAYKSITGYKDEFIPMMDKNTAQVFSFMLSAALSVSFKIGLIFVIIAAADYAFQRHEHISNLKMTKQEIKDENKQTEGDPKVKSRIRTMQLRMARTRMMNSVPKADVVITNPTHFAVALKYKPDVDQAPRLVAKGQNLVAAKIKMIAEKYQIPIVEDPPLARALYKAVDLDQEVPSKFFQAVAEVLAYVYKLKDKNLN